jgi:hypothetical protein
MQVRLTRRIGVNNGYFIVKRALTERGNELRVQLLSREREG